jgi:hypothetical protein
LLLPAVTSLLCRESRGNTAQAPQVQETGDDQRLVVQPDHYETSQQEKEASDVERTEKVFNIRV